MTFKVIEVIDGDTFRVSPNWKWNGEVGNKIRPIGYNTPEEGSPDYQSAKDKLKKLIHGEEVELKNVVKFTFDRLLCDVYYNGKNLANYFPKYQ